MSDEVEVVWSHPYQGNTPGSRSKIPAGDAHRLTRAGMCRPAKVTDARAAGVDPDTAASKRHSGPSE